MRRCAEDSKKKEEMFKYAFHIRTHFPVELVQGTGHVAFLWGMDMGSWNERCKTRLTKYIFELFGYF